MCEETSGWPTGRRGIIEGRWLRPGTPWEKNVEAVTLLLSELLREMMPSLGGGGCGIASVGVDESGVETSHILPSMSLARSKESSTSFILEVLV